MAGLHEEARGYPSCQGWDIGRLSQQGRVGRSVWLLAMLVGCFLDTMAGAIFFFHLIRECNTSSKQFSPNWPEMLKPNPERIPLPLSLRGTLSYPALILLKYKIFTQKSWVCLTLHFSVFKNKIKIYSWYVLRCFSIRDLKKNKIILLNGKLNTREQVVWK